MAALHVYTDFDSTVVLTDTGNTLLSHQIGHIELDRIDRLPEAEVGRVSLRKAEDMKWETLKLSVKEAIDIVVAPEDNVLLEDATENSTTAIPTNGFNAIPFGDRDLVQPGHVVDAKDALNDKYRVRLDPGFKQFHRFCQDNGIPITIISIGIQPLIEEMLNRYLGVDHGITVRANGLTIRPDGHWKVVWRDSSPFGVEKGRAMREARAQDLKNPSADKILWCGDGSSDFPAALVADIVLARENTSLEKLCRANQIPHRSFTTFETVQDVAQEWLDQQESKSRQEQNQLLEPLTTTIAAAASATATVPNGSNCVLVEP
ncbi:hypothetical protein FBU30_009758 [Linnemannia zychae]|nr:hypothetical protein FBU30_009758 [Linnemannia zychae]